MFEEVGFYEGNWIVLMIAKATVNGHYFVGIEIARRELTRSCEELTAAVTIRLCLVWLT